jgi:hypothetical protein
VGPAAFLKNHHPNLQNAATCHLAVGNVLVALTCVRNIANETLRNFLSNNFWNTDAAWHQG